MRLNLTTKVLLGSTFVAVVILSIISVRYYSFVFARKVSGEVIEIDRVTDPNAIVGRQLPPSQIFSFAMAIREFEGPIVTASSEDRQWAVVNKGQCVEAKFFPYPPWEFEKGGTYFGARLLRIYDCPSKQE